ncbi:MAG: hypothetical protein ACJ71K_02550 [Nitrososphaeraceae archaeon]
MQQLQRYVVVRRRRLAATSLSVVITANEKFQRELDRINLFHY